MIECFDFQIIAVFFIFSEFFDFKKKNIERKLIFSEKIMSFFLFIIFAFLIKNLFLIDLSIFYFSIFSVISMIQFSVFLKALFSDFLRSAFSVFSFTADLLISALLIFFLVSTSMCLQCL